MSIFFSTIFICLIVGAVVFLYAQYNIQLKRALGKEPSAGISLARKTFPDKSASSTLSDTQWKAVKVKTDLMCCRSAENMRGQVFLVSEAPEFPLKNCSSKECLCRYIHMNDRREGDDRRETTEFLKELSSQQKKNRRKIEDRRQVNI